jgi:hypothetical protein
MGRRGTNAFKRSDAVRAVESARAAGITPTMLEIVALDGTVFRIYGHKALPGETPEIMSAAAWDEAIAREKAAKAKRLKE